jgi:hypothetical protein
MECERSGPCWTTFELPEANFKLFEDVVLVGSPWMADEGQRVRASAS